MNKKFTDFISHIESQREISLAIANGQRELDDFVSSLEESGFRQVIDTHELFRRVVKPVKIFYLIKDPFPKPIYDFMVQYPTGQVEIFDKASMRSDIIIPVYHKVSIVFLVRKDRLLSIEKEGYSLRENTGITLMV